MYDAIISPINTVIYRSEEKNYTVAQHSLCDEVK